MKFTKKNLLKRINEKISWLEAGLKMVELWDDVEAAEFKTDCYVWKMRIRELRKMRSEIEKMK